MHNRVLRVTLFISCVLFAIGTILLGSNDWLRNIVGLIIKLYPELDQDEEFSRLIMHDLFYKGLSNTRDIDFPLVNRPPNPYAVRQRTTGLGKEFLNFISEPSFK